VTVDDLVLDGRTAGHQSNTPTFVRTNAEAAPMDYPPDYVLLRPVLLELMRRCPARERGLVHRSPPIQALSTPW
jgi:hypothetical protein